MKIKLVSIPITLSASFGPLKAALELAIEKSLNTYNAVCFIWT